MIKPIGNLRGAVVVWLISYAFFLLTLANNFSASHDSIHYLLNIISGQHLFHQHHLLYFFYAHTWMELFRLIFPSVPDYYLIESFTAVWGSANLAVCYLFFRNRFGLPAKLAAIGVALIGFSYGAWFYSVNIEVYGPPIFFLLSALYIITRNQTEPGDVWKVAVLQSMAILFHQVNVLFTPVVVYWIWMNRRTFKLIPSLIRYSLLGIVLAGGVYVFCGVFYEQKNTLDEFVGWIRGYTSSEYSFWQSLSPKTPVNAAAGFSRAFIGGHFIFQHPYLQGALNDSFRSHGLKDEIFLAKGISSSMTWVLSVFASFVAVTLLVMSVRFATAFKTLGQYYKVIRPLLLSIVVYSIFFLFWMPEILEFWIFQMILAWLLLIGLLPSYRFPLKISPVKGLVVLAVLLFSVNYFGSMRWLQKMQSDWFYVETMKLDKTLTAADIVFVEDEWILKDYVRYFTRARVIASDEPGYKKEDAERMMQETLANNGKVYAYRKSGDGLYQWVLIQ